MKIGKMGTLRILIPFSAKNQEQVLLLCDLISSNFLHSFGKENKKSA